MHNDDSCRAPHLLLRNPLQCLEFLPLLLKVHTHQWLTREGHVWNSVPKVDVPRYLCVGEVDLKTLPIPLQAVPFACQIPYRLDLESKGQ
jgi:hypothetical protein